MKLKCLKCGNDRVVLQYLHNIQAARRSGGITSCFEAPQRETPELVEDYYQCHRCGTHLRVEYKLSTIEALGKRAA